uniref:TonB_C domain-containing protein n=1 Tax=Macrostomum lignano TaxID=282301 RepID=A0A1I8IJG8_9PLAT
RSSGQAAAVPNLLPAVPLPEDAGFDHWFYSVLKPMPDREAVHVSGVLLNFYSRQLDRRGQLEAPPRPRNRTAGLPTQTVGLRHQFDAAHSVSVPAPAASQVTAKPVGWAKDALLVQFQLQLPRSGRFPVREIDELEAIRKTVAILPNQKAAQVIGQ